MLADSHVATRLPAKDLERAKRFYSEKLGLQPVEERPGGLSYRCSSGYFALFESAGAASGSHTQMAWEVADIEATVAALRTRGVVFEEYDLPGLTTLNGIAEIEGNYPSKGIGERAAWFRDSEGNLLGLGEPVATMISPVDSAVAELGDAFVSGTANVNRTTLHYVRGGVGPAVILQHGFPQDWYAFRRIMPRLAANFTVVSVDMRGVGGSAVIADGYDAATVAEDIRQLAAELDLGSIYFVGQDNGGIVAYTFARLYPQMTRGVMILDVPLPGIEPWEEVKADPLLWHFGFHQTVDLPEQLVAGREFTYFRAFFDRFALRREAISDQDVAHYVRAYAGVERLRAGLEFYRSAYPSSERFNATTRSSLRVPIVLAGGDRSTGPANMTIANALREHGCEDVTVEPVKDSGHWVVDEQPALVAALIERYAA